MMWLVLAMYYGHIKLDTRFAMSQFNIAEAKSHLSELVQKALLGEEVVIAKDNKPLIRLVPVVAQAGVRKPGSAKGMITYMAADFDATPDDFQAYL